MKKRICKCLQGRKWIQHTKSTCGWCLTRIWNLNAETFDSRIVSLIKSFFFFCTVLECVCVCVLCVVVFLYSVCSWCLGIPACTRRCRPPGSRSLRSHRCSCRSSSVPSVLPHTHCRNAHLHKNTHTCKHTKTHTHFYSMREAERLCSPLLSP